MMIPIQRLFSLCSLLLVVTAGLTLAACGGGGGGNNDDQLQLEFTIPSTPELDGVVFGDNVTVDSRTDLQPAVGDGSFQNNGAARFVAHYSFDISQIPAGATIKTATLSLFNRATQGDPQGMMVLVRIDHVEYGANFPQTILGAQGLDFNFATINDIGTLGRKNVDVKAQLQADIDAARATSQYRLRGAIASNLDNVADVAFLTDGEDTFGTGELPLLVVEIEQP